MSASSDLRREQFKALIDTAEVSDADICSIAGRNREGDLLFYAIYATNEAARDLEIFMQSQEEEVSISGNEESSEESAGAGEERSEQIGGEANSE